MEAEQKSNVWRPCGESPSWKQPFYDAEQQSAPSYTHTPPPPAPPPTCTTSFLISDYIDSTCFGMLNSPYTGIALAITKGQQSSTLRFLNRALSQHVGTRESSRVKNVQFIETLFDISLLSSTARRHGIWMISQENVAILLEFQACESHRACSYL